MIKLNGKEINPTMFPDGTSQVWQLDFNPNSYIDQTIRWEFERESELFHVVQLHDLLWFSYNRYNINLKMPYLPYARQDKKYSNNETFALRSFAKVLNACNFSQVKTFDAHSNIADSLINKFFNIEPNLEFVKDYDLVCFPDAGALKRYKHLVEPWNKQIFHAEKIRDQKTGWITHYDIVSNYQPIDMSVIVVDDLCDGGMTFSILADSLHEMGVSRIDLYVTHGIFSKGVKELLTKYNRIITTDTRFTNVNLDVEAVGSKRYREIRDSVRAGRLTIRKVW